MSYSPFRGWFHRSFVCFCLFDFLIQLSLWIMFLSGICLVSRLLFSLTCLFIIIVCCYKSSAARCLWLMKKQSSRTRLYACLRQLAPEGRHIMSCSRVTWQQVVHLPLANQQVTFPSRLLAILRSCRLHSFLIEKKTSITIFITIQ